MSAENEVQEIEANTRTQLHTLARSLPLRSLSRLPLPQIDSLVESIARTTPAGNIPDLILSGLSQLPRRKPTLEMSRQHTNRLFEGLASALDTAVYTTFFAGPAAVLWGYQNLLRLAGKSPEDAFPEGTWQFYVGYALREDTARHTTETHGFDTSLRRHQIELTAVDRLTAWTLAASHCLYQYEALLSNEWRERYYLHALCHVTRHLPKAARFARLYRQWERLRPYGRGQDVPPDQTYPQYRRDVFNHFLEAAMADLPRHLLQEWVEMVSQARGEKLPAYQRQLSILAYLEAGKYGEIRRPFPFKQAHIGLIYRGRYYLLPASDDLTGRPAGPARLRAQIAAMMAGSDPAVSDPLPLATCRRAAWPRLRRQLDPRLVDQLDRLRFAPILINCEQQPRHLPLSQLRRADRGSGDHALTLFQTGSSVVFDLSHIFFDGAWGAALAEILTNEAIAWAVYLHSLPAPEPEADLPEIRPLPLTGTNRDHTWLTAARRHVPEAAAETSVVNLKTMLALRRLFKQRNDLLSLTVNDILVFYRFLHAATYKLDPQLRQELQQLAQTGNPSEQAAAELTLATIQPDDQPEPAILIPVDASRRQPQARVHPMSFSLPVRAIELYHLHQETMAALTAYNQTAGAYEIFDERQRYYLATLAGLAAVLFRAKEIAAGGESTTVGALKLLAHVPPPVQQWLNRIPSQFDLLNDLIRGREVFSNIGAVVDSSTLTRFMTAKDDNEQKTLAWGIITDAEQGLHITLRDCRPHVAALIGSGRQALADRIAYDYAVAYGQGLNRFIRELLQITLASRETQLAVDWEGLYEQ
jgi:hypothetical protein